MPVLVMAVRNCASDELVNYSTMQSSRSNHGRMINPQTHTLSLSQRQEKARARLTSFHIRSMNPDAVASSSQTYNRDCSSSSHSTRLELAFVSSLFLHARLSFWIGFLSPSIRWAFFSLLDPGGPQVVSYLFSSTNHHQHIQSLPP